MARRSSAILVLVVALAGATTAMHARDWSPAGRDQALEQTRSPHLDVRRLAYARLAEIGTMADVPVLLAALWDEEALIRGVAEQSIWGIWLRTDDSSADPLFQTGMQLLAEDSPREALQKFDEVIVLKPEFAEVWNQRGNAWSALEEEDRALADYGRALELNPAEFASLQSCGEIWLTRGNYRKAAEFLRRALELNPNLSDAAEMLEGIEEKLENDRI